MARGFEIFDGLASQNPPIPEGSVVSRLILSNEHVKVVLVGFAPGETLSEPRPGQPAIIEVWRGEGLVTIGLDRLYEDGANDEGDDDEAKDDLNFEEPPAEQIEEVYAIGPGSWVYLDAGTPHTIESKSEMILLLTLLKGENDDNA